MKHQKQDKHKHDHYVNPHVIRAMINMIAKQRWEHKIIVHIKHGCLKSAIHACQESNNHGIYILIYKHQNML